MKLTGLGPNWRDANGQAPIGYKAAIERLPNVPAEEPDEE
jgi:hypothetical protein